MKLTTLALGLAMVACQSPTAPAPPRAVLDVGCIKLRCSMDATRSTSDAGIINYRISPEEGVTAWSQPVITYSYRRAGTYLVTLIVIDRKGQGSEWYTFLKVEE